MRTRAASTPEPLNGSPTDRPVVLSVRAGSYVVVTAAELIRFRDSDSCALAIPRLWTEPLMPTPSLSHHLAIAERDVDGLFERQVPHRVVFVVLERQRRQGAIDFVESRLLDVRIVDVGGDVEIVR